MGEDGAPPMQIETLNLEELKGKVLVVKVGAEGWPASDEDLAAVQEALTTVLHGSGVTAVITHHAVELSAIPFEELARIVMQKVVGEVCGG